MFSARRFALLCLAILVAPASLVAQSADGFRFHPPKVILSGHGGFSRSSADSEVFDFMSELLTLSRGDFDGFVGGASIGVPLSNRLVGEFRGEMIGRQSGSEFRNWVDSEDRPIEQHTEYYRVPITVGARIYPGGLGERIGTLAWIPSAFAPYLSGAAGVTWYRLRQVGDFVDFDTLEIFPDELNSEGWAPSLTGAAGLDFSVTPFLSINVEGRYLWANSDLDRDFADFDPIDLSGMTGSVGFSLRL